MKVADFDIGATYAAQELDFIDPITEEKSVGQVRIFTVLEPAGCGAKVFDGLSTTDASNAELAVWREEFLRVRNTEGTVLLLHPSTLARAVPVDNLS